ncbi:hypothetical protein SGO26_17020 [Cupriavidus metallidurans]|uniref:hypothetical protein n=1 Tax=Cupriavidus TaxID=106589 RepID=UPI000E9878B8|nr:MULTISPECIES: hypothetical protein [unclassified Cupriavidus]GMG92586.1 hypothetical protein Cmtc_38060 [Cupriavidus sp. TKC]HBD32658.1 hypothetical protein [Cupriavidus sp.]HBO82021.1 hypothetical protein [Cupriavidus sp.]
MANYIEEYCARIRRGGARGLAEKPVVIGQDNIYAMQYVPYEHWNSSARLVIVSTTPGHTHVRLAATVTEELLQTQAPGPRIQRENKRRVELGGRMVRPNLIRMLDHFRVPALISQPDATSLWDEEGFDSIQPLALLPHATTRRGLTFDGPLDELLDTPMLRDVFQQEFLGRLPQYPRDALYIGLGRTAWSGLEHAVRAGLLCQQQLLGMMPVPTRAGSMVRYFLREVGEADLSPNDPVRHRIAWLDAAHREMEAGVERLRAESISSAQPRRLTA